MLGAVTDSPSMDDLYDDAEAALAFLDEYCAQQKFFVDRIRVPGAQLTSVPLFCVRIVPGGGERVTFHFRLDDEQNIRRPGADAEAVAKECVEKVFEKFPRLAALKLRTSYTHVGIPPVDPETLPRPAPVPHLDPLPEVTGVEAREIVRAFFEDHIEKHNWFAEALKGELPRLESTMPLGVNGVLWRADDGELLVKIRLDDDPELDPDDPPAAVTRIIDEALARLAQRHPELAPYAISVRYEN